MTKSERKTVFKEGQRQMSSHTNILKLKHANKQPLVTRCQKSSVEKFQVSPQVFDAPTVEPDNQKKPFLTQR